MKIKYLLLFLALPICFSCSDDLLNQKPSTSVSDEQIMTEVVAARTALMGAYRIFSVKPNPLHVSQAPNGLLKENILGSSSSILTP